MNCMFVGCSDDIIYKLKGLYNNFGNKAFEEEEIELGWECTFPAYY